MGLGGLEPPTSALSGQRSNRLSYRPAGVYSIKVAEVHSNCGLTSPTPSACVVSQDPDIWLTKFGDTTVVDVHPQTLQGGVNGFWILRLRAE